MPCHQIKDVRSGITLSTRLLRATSRMDKSRVTHRCGTLVRHSTIAAISASGPSRTTVTYGTLPINHRVGRIGIIGLSARYNPVLRESHNKRSVAVVRESGTDPAGSQPNFNAVRVPDASHGIAARPSYMIAKVACILKWFETH